MKILAPAADCLGEPVVITNARHYALLAEAGTALERVALELGRGATVDLVLGELNCALEALGRITGRTPSEDLLQSIFSRFCVGK
jgi:tRNA modification GTPase